MAPHLLPQAFTTPSLFSEYRVGTAALRAVLRPRHARTLPLPRDVLLIGKVTVDGFLYERPHLPGGLSRSQVEGAPSTMVSTLNPRRFDLLMGPPLPK